MRSYRPTLNHAGQIACPVLEPGDEQALVLLGRAPL